MNILLGVTGSVAAKLTPKLLDKLSNHDIRIVMTDKAPYFIKPEDTPAIMKKTYIDGDEWVGDYYKKDMEVMHIQLAQWADMFLICPITANTLAKIANGICDNLLTCVVRAWGNAKPLIIAPAMNTIMWLDNQTENDIYRLYDRYNLFVVPPQSKKLACGTEGEGALADLDTIISTVNKVNER